MRISDRISYFNPKDREAGALLQADLIRRIQMQKKDSQQVVVLCVWEQTVLPVTVLGPW